MALLSKEPTIFVLAVLLHAISLKLSYVSGQTYLNNHQQFMHSMDWETIIAQAIGKADKGMYGITGTIEPANLDLVKRPILAKIAKNKPQSNPFDIQWAVTYLTPGEPQQPSFMDFNVTDVLYTRQEGYVIAGQVRFLDVTGAGTNSDGFLLRTDAMGHPFVFKVYEQLEVLMSLVQHTSGDGFSAVGASSYEGYEDEGQAAILSVTYDLDPICFKKLIGRFEEPYTAGILNKVIAHEEYFLSVGKVAGISPNVYGYEDSDVLYTSFDEQCNILANNHYGSTEPTYLSLNAEVGNSLTVQGNRVLITGFMKRYNLSPYDPDGDEDILYMALKFDGSLILSFRYDIQQDLDIGMAITWRQESASALIAGETVTRKILGSGLSKDIFLLELEPKGQFRKLELFGTTMTNEFHVDLTLSQEKNAVMLSNTPINSICDTHGPWLIERYDTIIEQCRDAPYETSREKVELETKVAIETQSYVEQVKYELVAMEVQLEQWTMCPKLKL